MQIPPTIAAEQALTRQNIALETIRHGFEQDQLLVKLVDQAARSAPVSGSRGANVNTSA